MGILNDIGGYIYNSELESNSCMPPPLPPPLPDQGFLMIPWWSVWTNACLRTSRGVWCLRHAGELWRGAAGLCSHRVYTCASAAESLHKYTYNTYYDSDDYSTQYD